ncbi:hypothetical protein GCM10027082_24430 [Comamonas humi]
MSSAIESRNSIDCSNSGHSHKASFFLMLMAISKEVPPRRPSIPLRKGMWLGDAPGGGETDYWLTSLERNS